MTKQQPDFKIKVNGQRPYPKDSASPLDTSVESDRGRIINSAAIRRLQQKTQVFPLERNAAVRSRLTHSLEVQQAGRFICQKIAKELKYRRGKDYGFVDIERSIESIVEMACLMHDIGNPPFGHFGEKAISDWFVAELNDLWPQDIPSDFEQLQLQMSTDLHSFEGNAQAIRLVSTLLNLNITYTQAAAILKYTRPAFMAKSERPKHFDYLMKKPGYYLSEHQYVDDLRKHLQMAEGCRHPLSYIMEAADDISYCYADIEDAVEKHILTIDALIPLLEKAFEQLGGDINALMFRPFKEQLSFKALLQQSYRKYLKAEIDKKNRFFVDLRVNLNHILTNHAVNRFVDNLDAIYDGTFNQALLEDDSPAHKLAETFKAVALAHVFSHHEVELQELRGYRIIQGLLRYYQPLLKLSAEEFKGLIAKDFNVAKHFAVESRLVNKLPGKHIRAYRHSLKQHKTNQPEFTLWEFYYRCRLMQDFVSGMTDQFALDQYHSLTVQN